MTKSPVGVLAESCRRLRRVETAAKVMTSMNALASPLAPGNAAGKGGQHLIEISKAPSFHLATTPGFVRYLNIFSVFNKDAREKERARLKDEMNRGYFDDFRELKKTGGKVAVASQNLVPVLAAGRFPKLAAYTATGEGISLPLNDDLASSHATVICLAFRATAQSMIESWTRPLSDNFNSSSSVELIQISVVESWFLSLSPVRRVLLGRMRTPELADGEQSLKKRVVYAFGDTYFFRKELGIPNVLAGYLFLLDKKGRVRWRASGPATAEEISFMVSCISRLLKED